MQSIKVIENFLQIKGVTNKFSLPKHWLIQKLILSFETAVFISKALTHSGFNVLKTNNARRENFKELILLTSFSLLQ